MKINGEMHYLWRAVDQEGEVLESFVTKGRDKAAALKFIKKALETPWPDAGDRHRRPGLIRWRPLAPLPARKRDLWLSHVVTPDVKPSTIEPASAKSAERSAAFIRLSQKIACTAKISSRYRGR